MIQQHPFVLLVEDDEVLRKTVSRTLRAAGYMVLEAATFKQAADRMHIKPQVMILNLNLPDATCWDAAGWLEQFTSPVPMIVTSGVQPDSKKLARFKPKACLARPFAMRELLNLVEQYAPTGQEALPPGLG